MAPRPRPEPGKAAAKRGPKPKSAAAVSTSFAGTELIDGQPYFGTHRGVRMNRRQYLAATAPERKAALVEALRDSVEDEQ